MKKPVLFFTIADDNNLKYAKSLENSFKKFHKDIPFYIVQGEELKRYTTDDPAFFYRSTPVLAERFIKEYDLVVKIDADSVVLGDLSYIWETKDYDIGGVLNYNLPDAQTYGLVQQQGILPIEYVNCGLVAMRSEQFIHEWSVWCFTPQFERYQYREQDGLNIKIYHGNWNCRIFDHGDGPANMYGFWGLFGKTFWNKAELRGNKIIVPKVEGGIPQFDTEIKIAHMAGGAGTKKDAWGLYFNEKIMKRISFLISEGK